MANGLIDALDQLLKRYDGSYSAGIDKAIDEACGPFAIHVRGQFREEDARYTHSWPAMLGRQPWQVESAHGRSAVLVRLQKDPKETDT